MASDRDSATKTAIKAYEERINGDRTILDNAIDISDFSFGFFVGYGLSSEEALAASEEICHEFDSDFFGDNY